jgi:hypothetical protein
MKPLTKRRSKVKIKLLPAKTKWGKKMEQIISKKEMVAHLKLLFKEE